MLGLKVYTTTTQMQTFSWPQNSLLYTDFYMIVTSDQVHFLIGDVHIIRPNYKSWIWWFLPDCVIFLWIPITEYLKLLGHFTFGNIFCFYTWKNSPAHTKSMYSTMTFTLSFLLAETVITNNIHFFRQTINNLMGPFMLSSTSFVYLK